MGQHENLVENCPRCTLIIRLLEKVQNDGQLTKSELEAAKQIAYEKYGFKDANDFVCGTHFKNVQDKIWTSVPENIQITSKEKILKSHPISSSPYVSLTELAKQSEEKSTAYVIHSWMRSGNTLEFLALWERKHNPDFSEGGYQKLIQKCKYSGSTVTPAQWIKETNAIGMISRRGNNGGTSAHLVIACDFMMWLSAEFRLHLLGTMHMLKRQ